MDQLATKISLTIDELGMLLDHLHRFSQLRRQRFYQQIVQIKNKLVQLKTSLRQSNMNKITALYEQHYVAYVSLRSQIHSEEKGQNYARVHNVSESRPRDKKKHANNMEILVEKTEQIKSLQKRLESAEEELKNKEYTLRDFEDTIKKLIEENQAAKLIKNEMHIELTRTMENESVLRIEVERARKNERHTLQLLEHSQQDIKRLNEILIITEAKEQEYQQITDSQLSKARLMEENMQKYEREIGIIKDRSLMKDHQFRALVQELEVMKGVECRNNLQGNELSRDNKRLEEDNRVLEKEVTSLQDKLFQIKTEFQEYKEWKESCYRDLEGKYQEKTVKSFELEKIMTRLQTNYKQCSEDSEEVRRKLDAVEEENSSLEKVLSQIKKERVNLEIELKRFNMERQTLSAQVEKAIIQNRQLQAASNECRQANYRQECDFEREIGHQKQQRAKLEQYVNELERQIHDLKKDQAHYETSSHSYSKTLQETTQRLKMAQGETETLRSRLIKAKIEAIRDIRDIIV